MKRAVSLSILLVFVLCAALLWSENGQAPGAAETEEEVLSAPEQKVEPVFPSENEALIFIEGEDAVSTNFSNEPILNYSCSGFRTLQLNRRTGLQGGRPFYATFVLYTEAAGTYELWYGGTPPGPADELLPSYSSPFSYRLDGGEIRSVDREEMAVVEQYAPSYYWNYVGDVELAAGQHTIEFLVSLTRGYDSKFYFYLDCFFLVNKQKENRLEEGPLPEVFPRNRKNRSIDSPFKSFEDYQILIRDNPDNLGSYLEIARIYSLVGDYLSALKYLRRAGLLDPENVEVQLLTAKNLIWKGEVVEGLKTYRSLLLLDPSRLDIWLEAGKVAAWTGRYQESIEFYRNALDQHPDNLDLVANLGLTHLWAGERLRADESFQKALTLAATDRSLVAELARSYSINGVPERGISLLRSSLKRHVDKLALYLQLQQLYTRLDRGDKAEEIRKLISATFRASEKLANYLELFATRESLKDRVIDGYEQELVRQPDNLELREVLAQTYFWNGKRRKAIGELQNVLANHAFIQMGQLDQDSLGLLEMLDRSYLYLVYFNGLPSAVKDRKAELATKRTRYEEAQKANEKFKKEVEAAREKGQAPPVPPGKDPQDVLKLAEQELAMAVEKARLLAGQIDDLVGAANREWQRLAELVETDKKAAETFGKLIKPIRWEWDRKNYVAELQSIGGVLADYVLGKIFLSEGTLEAAEQRLLRQTEAQNLPRQYQTALFRALLWQAEIPEAFKVLETGQFDPFTIIPYWENLKTLRIKADVAPLSAAAGLLPRYSEAELEAALTALGQAEQQVQDSARELQQTQRALHRLYQERLVRSMYRLGENTFLIRHQLGEFYLKEEDLPAAIRQYKQVLAIDPWATETIYDLGTIYEWSGDWKAALSSYQRVYWADPLYKNVAARYNQLSRQHADTLDFEASTFSDGARIQYHGEVTYTTSVSTLLGLSFAYAADNIRVYDVDESPANILVHTAMMGFPLYFHTARLRLTPSLGAQFLNDLYNANDNNVTAAEFFGFLDAEPRAGLDLGLALGRYLYLNGSSTWGRKKESLTPGRDRIFTLAGELNLSTSLSFIKAYPFRYSSLRTSGKAEALSEYQPGSGFSYDNFMYTAAQELNIGLLRMQGPYLELNLLGNFAFENSERFEDTDYYTPIGVMVAGGGLAGSAWIPVAEASSLNVGLRAVVGNYWEKMLTPADTIRRIQIEAEGNLGYSKGDAHYSLRAVYSTTYKYLDAGTEVGDWDYWSLSVLLGASSKLPRLLAP